MAKRPVTTADILDGHVSLDLECLDRIYLNGYVPNLQVGGQVVQFLALRGFPIPSPVVVGRIGDQFRRSVRSFADTNQIPMIKFGKGDRKIETMKPYLARQAEAGPVRGGGDRVGAGVPAGRDLHHHRGPERWGSALRLGPGRAAGDLLLLLRLGRRFRAGVRQDRLLLPVSDQGVAERARVGETAGHQGRDRLDRAGQRVRRVRRPGRVAADLRPARPGPDPGVLRPVAGPAAAAVDRRRTGATGIGGSCRCGRSRCPARWCSTTRATAGLFFEALVADNLDLGRPEQIELIFGRKILPSTPGVFATRVVTRGVDVTINVGYKHSRTKQYFKEGRALRIETVVNDPTDLGVLRRLVHLPELQAKARDVNRRLLDHEHVGQGCVLASPAFERIARPSLVDGRRAPALRFGDPRVQALAGALAITAHLIGGFTNKSLRPLVAGLLGEPTTARPAAATTCAGSG